MVVFDNVSHSYGQRSICRNLSLIIDSARVHLSGPNGSGKTSLLLLMAGLLKPAGGNITFAGQNVLAAASKQHIGISASKIALPAFMTVKELLKFHMHQFHCNDYEEWASQFGLLPYMPTKISDLSLGNYKKLSLITALVHQPKLLLLDEPTNGLDDRANEALKTILCNYPGQVIVASHDDLLSAENDVQHIQLQDANTGVM